VTNMPGRSRIEAFPRTTRAFAVRVSSETLGVTNAIFPSDKKKKEDEAKASDGDELDTAVGGPACDRKICAAGEHLDGDCFCQGGGEEGTRTKTTLNGKDYPVEQGPHGRIPGLADLPKLITEILIGTTTIYSHGTIDGPDIDPATNSCKGRTGDGCYLRAAKVQTLDGETEPVCMVYCLEPPVIQTADPKPPVGTKPPTKVTETPTTTKEPPVVAKQLGKPAVQTGTATTYLEPKLPPTPAVKTATATTYVEPKAGPTPAVKTATATTYVEPEAGPTPAVKTATAATYVEPKAGPTPAVKTATAATYVEPTIGP